jgi:L-threonylcarbamoyladenylate synthase
LPPNISPNENIAVRLPDSAIARSIIRAAGGALATTSANRSGERPAHNAAEARKALDGLVAAVVDGGPVAVGIPSTIVDCTGESPRILRQGPLAAAALSLDTA